MNTNQNAEQFMFMPLEAAMWEVNTTFSPMFNCSGVVSKVRSGCVPGNM